MPRPTQFKILWTIWMVGGGLAAAVIAYAVTGDWRWTVGALLASGVILNTIGQIVTQPVKSVAASRRPRTKRPA